MSVSVKVCCFAAVSLSNFSCVVTTCICLGLLAFLLKLMLGLELFRTSETLDSEKKLRQFRLKERNVGFLNTLLKIILEISAADTLVSLWDVQKSFW
ncbi:uncharacterized protein [Physcomitrium patens]|uniref:uncharacterized protein isoform X2 n=1 Tax=Physcomitrium patens TaxID=3218 RepID=UPI003CCC91F9